MASPYGVEEIKILQSRRRDLADVVHNSMLSMLALSFFCFLAAGSSDRLLVVGEPSIKVPFADVPVSLIAFLGLAPALVIASTLYLHLFLGSYYSITSSLGESAEPLPKLFGLHDRLAILLSHLIFYWLPPLTLASIAYKGLGRPEWGVPLLYLTILATTVLSSSYWKRRSSRGKVVRSVHVLLAVVASTVLSVAVLQSRPEGHYHQSLVAYFRRPLSLEGADLNTAWLANAILEHCNCEKANLSGAYLRGAELSHANFIGANLSGANIGEADLRGAILMGSKLTGAVLREARLAHAKTNGADFSGADLENADMQHVRTSTRYMSGSELSAAFFKTEHKVGSDFRKANLRSANLAGAELTHAKLIDADLRGTNLLGAELGGADLSGAKTDDSTNFVDARYCKTTMPDGSVREPTCRPAT